jgi:hypothetical protein
MAKPKKSAARAPARAKSAAKKKASAPFTTTNREAAFRHFAPRVAHIAEGALERWHHDAELLATNAARCEKALAPHLDALAKKMPHVDMNEIRELGALGLALAFADAHVVPTANEAQIQKVQVRQRPRRKLALMQLEILRDLGLLEKPEKVGALLDGRGAIDQANDGVNAVALFNENAARIEGKHPFTQEWLAQLKDDSNWLLQQLKRKGVKSDRPSDQKVVEKDPAALVRDQIFTELVRRYGQAKKVAIEVWGWRQVDEFFPLLFERERSATAPAPKGAEKKKGAEAPAKDEAKPAKGEGAAASP